MILLEMTVYQLDRSTQNQFGQDRQGRSSKISVGNIEFGVAQAPGGKTELTAQATVRSNSGMSYTPMVVFSNVKLEQEDLPTNVTVKGQDGTDYHIAKNIANSDVKVRCNCMDFYWRFANWNMKHKSLMGNPPAPYAKTTDRPPVNPMQKPGICKHLYKLVQQLRSRGVM